MDKKLFYDHVRTKLGKLSDEQVEGFENVLKTLSGLPLSWQAYGLATTWHETAKTMQPVREGLSVSDAWRKKNLRYYPWYGRGYVQLTWEANYAKADRELSEQGLIKAGDLLKNADLAMRPDIAGFVLRNGMLEGWFSGSKTERYRFASFLPSKGVATREQYIQARRIINLLDKADLIEDYAQIFEKALRNGGINE